MKLIPVLLLMVVSTNVFSEWTAIAGGVTRTLYVDFTTIRRRGNLVKMWHLTNFKTTQTSSRGDRYLSSKGQDEYDCKEEQRRSLDFSWFSDNMGTGNVVDSGRGLNQWEPVASESIGEAKFKIACNIK